MIWKIEIFFNKGNQLIWQNRLLIEVHVKYIKSPAPVTCLTLCILETFQGTSTNSEDPDEMPHNAHNATFYQGIHCFVKAKKSSDKKIHFFEKL